MKNKLLLLVGTGIGYVLGARAGREKYDALVDQAQSLWGCLLYTSDAADE